MVSEAQKTNKMATHLELAEVSPKEVLDEETGPNVYLYHKGTQAVVITSGEAWYKRLWYVLTNPFTYLFAGKLRY
jgi:hypothetical protein